MQDISVEELNVKRNNHEDFLLIDVREEWEHDEFNIGGLLVPLATLPSYVEELEDWMNKEVIVHCKSGARSAAAKEYMVKQGFTNVRNLIGGIVAWQSKYA